MLKAEECVLVIVDVQGKLAKVVRQSEQLQHKLHTLVKAAQLFDMPILWLEQIPEKLGATTEEIANILKQSTTPIAKQHFSGWQAEAFQQQLKALGTKQVILAGIETHVCVYQTCRDLLDNGYQTHIVADAMSSRTEANKQYGIAMMQQHGALITNVESLLFELQHQAQGERFKALLKLIK